MEINIHHTVIVSDSEQSPGGCAFSISLGEVNQLLKPVDVLFLFPQKKKNQKENSRLGSLL